MRLRNMFVVAAALLFVYSMVFFASHAAHAIRGFAYLFGAGAYGSEMGILTCRFKKKLPLTEMLMPYMFGVLYIFMAAEYLGLFH